MRRLLRGLKRGLLATALALVAVSAGWVVLYRVVPPPVTPLMVLRAAEGAAITKTWVPLTAISPHLVHAVIGAEDSRFCQHAGFDWRAIQAAWAQNRQGGRMLGASTITMQTAKNVWLWPDRTWLRKGLEAWLTLGIELAWSKRRILETYLNLVEWGDGIYGAEAAARAHFGKPAAGLTRREAALLAAVLPNPRRWSPARPTRYIANRARILEQRMAVVARDGLAGCVGALGRPG